MRKVHGGGDRLGELMVVEADQGKLMVMEAEQGKLMTADADRCKFMMALVQLG